jgi:hypothetical protein
LKKAFEAASRLPDQDELAAAILEELEADERLEAAFAHSQDALARLADEALEEHRAGGLSPSIPMRVDFEDDQPLPDSLSRAT